MASSATIVWSDGGAVEGRGDDLALDRALHVRDLFGALVDEHDHEVDLGVVGRDRVRDLLHDDRLAGLRGRDDQAALALADGGDDVDHALREPGLLGLEAQALLRVERRQLAELGAALRRLRVGAVDRVQADERVELARPVALLRRLLALAGLADGTGDRVAAAQAVPLDLVERDVHVVRARQVARGAHERVAVHQVEDARDGQQDVVVADLDVVETRELARPGTTARATALAVPVTVAVAVARAPTSTAALLAVLAVLEALVTTVLARPAGCAPCWRSCWRVPCSLLVSPC